jgi:hypothetical protein
MILLYLVAALILLVVLLSAMASTRVVYTETIEVDAPIDQVYDDIRFQEHLMRWSAWPLETKSSCMVEGTDGEVGVRTAFFTRGKRTGHQEIIELKENESVTMTLVGPGPPHRPRLTFELRPMGGTRTRVLLHFVNELPRPFNAIWRFAGLTRWTRRMHTKDLMGLKAFAEPPHLDMMGQPVGRPPSGPNPWEHRP